MRYSDRITFVTESEGGYNPDKGEHDEVVITEDTKPCNINSLGVERSVKLFGEIDIGIIVARLQRPYPYTFDRVEIPVGIYKGEYNVKNHAPHRSKSVFYLEGVKL